MMPMSRRVLSIAAALLATATPTLAQTFETLGTRAAGMGGAFVAVADDASATYWNPAGLALGHLFSLVADGKTADVKANGPDDMTRHDTGWIFTLGMPALAFSHYQLRTSSVTPAGTKVVRFPQGGESPARTVRLDKLTTRHTGVTLVQSLFQGVAIGTTLKLVHGEVATTTAFEGNRDELVDQAQHLPTSGTNKFDADLGVMAGSGRVKLGLTIRNLTQPSFAVAGTSDTLRLDRQARAGVAVSVAEGWAVAGDFDLTKNGTAGVRTFAAGTEGRLTRKISVRSGFRLSTTGDARPSVAAGASYAVLSAIWIDGQATWGPENSERGWGLAARVLY